MLDQLIAAEYQMLVLGVGVGVSLGGTALYFVYRKLFVEPDSPKPIEPPSSETSSDTAKAIESTGVATPKEIEKQAEEQVFQQDFKEKVPAAEPVKATKDLKEALGNTRDTFFGRIKSVFSSNQTLGEDELEELEEILYTSDIGPGTVQRLVESVSERMSSDEKSDFEAVRGALKTEMISIFDEVEAGDVETFDKMLSKIDEEKPQVWMIVGVNGAGKTTTIGKLAHLATLKGRKTLVVAGDTFRAAAGDQLKVWTDRAGVEIFSPEAVSDPSAVVFDAIQSAKSKEYDLVIVDTAGRLHTQENLMEELKKMKRVMGKHIEEAPHETLIVLDSNSGQNALIQTEKFHEALGLTGAVLTKLDGSAKGGVAIGLASQFRLPIKLIGVGESMEDLRPFNPTEFVDSIL
tara:strand:+ start:78423 stop:79637 length:1215 start_codon:yes stop_codon:yes gene_type:complete